MTNQTLPGREIVKLLIIKLFSASESLASDIPAGDGKMANLFLKCNPPMGFDLAKPGGYKEMSSFLADHYRSRI